MSSARLDLRASLVLALILFVALVLRLHHLGWALPHTYEEAKPLHVAFQMWGWDRDGDVNLNPEFFNYPSLVLYIHFVVQGLLYLALKIGGGIQSVVDWQVLYLTDPSMFYLVERAVTVIFAVGSVWATAATARLVAGWPAALTAALLLAVNSFHIARSQLIEVDMPLTFFVMLSLWATVSIAQAGIRRHYLIAGVAIGLAVSCKYTGLFLVLPLVVAHALAPRSGRTLANLARAVGLMGIAFVLTSPFVLLNFQEFWRDLSMERAHMAEGQFGLAEVSTWRFYAKALAGGVVNPLVALAACAGAVVCARFRIRAATVLLAFAVAYLITISTWTMRAERYLLPLVPVAMVLAGVAVAALIHGKRRNWQVLVAVAIVLMCAIDADRHANSVSAIQSDARTDATDWVEANIPAGSFIVTEHQGPEFLSPVTLMQLDPGLREKVLARSELRPVYGVQMLPMTQTRPETSARFYSLDLYPNADIVVTSSAVKDRYERDPARFTRQIGFYAELESHFERVREFAPAREGGVRIVIYRRLPRERPFAEKDSIAPPPPLPASSDGGEGRAAAFYFELATNCEFFGFEHEAYVCYIRALDRGDGNNQVFMHCVLGVVRTLLATGQTENATRFLSQVSRVAPDEDARNLIAGLQRQIDGR